MKKIKVILSVLLMAAAISFTACSNASSGSDSDKTEKEDKKTETPKPASGNGSGSGSGSGSSGTPASTYIGTKAPSVAKAVGDIVFNDGSATPYTAGKRFNDTQKNAAVAIIFYVGDGLNSGSDTKTRTLGLGLKHTSEGLEWCTDEALAYNSSVNSIKCTYAGESGSYTIRDDKDGSDNLAQLSEYVKTISSDDDTSTAENYSAFYFAKDYSTKATNLGSFNTNWFLPSIAELNQLYMNGKKEGESRKVDIDGALEALGGNKLTNLKFWSASQSNDGTAKAYIFDFGTGSLDSKDKDDFSYNACAIRDFTTYTVTTESTAQVTITADKETATAGEKVTLTYTPAAPDDYDVTFNGFTVLNGSKAVKVEADNSFIMPAGNVNVSADIDYEDLYKISISSGTGGSVTASKTKGIKAGTTITLTVTPDVDYKLKSLSVMNGDTPVPVTNNSFTMPAGNITITAVFETKYIGSNNPSVAKKVGDIVFNDGSSMPYSEFESLDSDEQADLKTSAIALIFYTGTGLNSDKADGTPDTSKSRTLGVGLKHFGNNSWCSNGANAKSIKITTIQCEVTGEAKAHIISGDKNGSDNLKQLSDFLKATDGIEDDTGTEGIYYAFDYAKNYSSAVTNLGKFNEGWYIPSIAELYQIYVNGISDGKIFDIDTASKTLGGNGFNLSSGSFASSSQHTDPNYPTLVHWIWKLRSWGEIYGADKYYNSGSPINSYFYCCIREF